MLIKAINIKNLASELNFCAQPLIKSSYPSHPVPAFQGKAREKSSRIWACQNSTLRVSTSQGLQRKKYTS